MAAATANTSLRALCTVKITTESHDEHPRLLKHIFLKAHHPTEGEVGSLEALEIDRDRCKGDFLWILDEESQELSEFATALFDRLGRLKPELVENEHLKGTGTWGRELDNGKIIYVSSVDVEEKFRRNGVASLLLQELAQSTFAPKGTFLFAWPSPTGRIDKDEWDRQRKAAVDLFHKSGYRRVGRTSFLAKATDPFHRSHALAAADDVESHASTFQPAAPPAPHQGAGLRILPDGTMAWGEHEAQDSNSENDAVYPLHHMIESVVLGIPVQDIGGAIRDAYTQTPSLIHQKDDRGFTPLHAAAYAANLPAVQALLALPAEAGVADDVRARDNVAARTPLELCEQKMQDMKEMMQNLIGNWPGHSEDTLRTVFLLKRAAGENLAGTEDEFVAARRWGCTCGQCTDGWLSPRMRYRLKYEAEVVSDTMDVNTWGATSSQMYDTELSVLHLPREVRGTRITKGFYRDYILVVRTIADILRRPGAAGVPSAANVQATLFGQGGRFFAKGGKVEHAMDYVLRCAMDESTLGDGTWDDLQEEMAAEGSANAVAYAAMPQCDNDLDFVRVADRLALGTVDRYRGVGGYGGYGEDMDEDEDFDEDDDMMGSEERELLDSIMNVVRNARGGRG